MLAARARVVSRGLSMARGLSSMVRILSDGTPPKPPPPIDDSTSALDYKTSHKVRPPPLPKMDRPRSRHVLNCLVQNEPGVLSRVSGILAGRGFNINSFVVCRTELRNLSRMCIVISGQYGVVEQARRQLEDFPEYLEDQLEGGPSHEPRAAHRAYAEQTKLEREMVLMRHFEESTRLQPPSANPAASEGEEGGKQLTPSEALRRRHRHLHSLHVLANQFGAMLVDVSE
ncbi:acetolactate synthase [Lactarius sanguifluus]|nr:acetolactate synthase [Lactarius sanguifluus]